ncbi:MAG: respiratory nitrate reductase subunit gamma [Epsilonproteobacteria bacterium]|nr:MAG: respiratory nitrate reductase subunit gamma [Campylobacterota bacterium]RLA65623.1 MAG: respiratory nitrate reductase subunit gamma [Campylobacterota bacterium]
MLNLFLFVILPYVAIILELVVSIYRYYNNSYKFSSLSSEFLESDQLFWGSVPFHYGIITILLGHVIGFLFPSHVLAFGAVPVRLLIIEVTALIFGLLALFGLIMLVKRRMTDPRVQVVSTKMDFFILILLLLQVASGVGTAVMYRWGMNWYAISMVPYLKSLVFFKPDMSYVASMPWMVKFHIVNAFLIIAVLPFTRLLHFLVLPVHYLWRSWQVVIWNYDRKKIRKSK